jgi:hypothetical protein
MRWQRALLLTLGLGSLASGSRAGAQVIGSPAPAIRGAESGDGDRLTLDTFRGKVAMFWYESKGKDVQALNAPLKAAIKSFAEHALRHPDQLVVIPIGDVSHILWPFKGLARSRLREVSKELGLTVYGDWDGEILRAYRFYEDDSNLMFIDQSGIIRFRVHGKIPSRDYPAILARIRELVDGEDAAPDPKPEP